MVSFELIVEAAPPKKIAVWSITCHLTNYPSKVKVIDRSQGRPECSLFNTYYTEGATPFHGLFHITLDTYLIMLSVKQGGIKYHFLSLWYDSIWV